MKKRRNKFLDIRVQFFFICMAGFIGVALLAALAAWGLEHLGVNVPMFVWLLIFTLLLGSATAAGFSIAFFAPISRLSRAMKEVAGGNFRVHVETKSVFRDIRDSFDSFNLMVSDLANRLHLERLARVQNAHQRDRGLRLTFAGAPAIPRGAGGVHRQDSLQYAQAFRPRGQHSAAF